jgi:hypothetical protein
MPIGSDCFVQFNRNLLGSTSQTPVYPTFPGSAFSVEGKLLKVDSDWVVLDLPNANPDQNPPVAATVWIPRQSILLLESYHNHP